MSGHPNRSTVRAEIAAGGWSMLWGDLVTETDMAILNVSFPTGTVEAWVSQQVESQLQKFSQTLDEVSDEIISQATNYLKSLLGGKNFGQRDIDGLEVKAGITTYNRKFESPVEGAKLLNPHQSYVGLRVTKPLPPRAPKTTIIPSFDSKSWYKITNAAKPGMALDVINDGNQKRDGRLQMAAEGNFSGQFWQLRPSKTIPGAYNLSTMWLGTNRCLDVYGNDKTTPHLAKSGAYSGQQWYIESQGNGTWRLRNSYSGTLALAAAAGADESGLHLGESQTLPTSQWILEPITEKGIGQRFHLPGFCLSWLSSKHRKTNVLEKKTKSHLGEGKLHGKEGSIGSE